MNGHVRLSDSLGALMLRRRLYQPARALLALGAMLALRALADALWQAFAGPGNAGMFPDAADRYADLVKVALSYHFLLDGVVKSGAYHGWPEIFQTYLFSHDYDNSLANLANPHATQPGVFHLPPVATLLYLAAARITALAGPVTVLLGFFALYGGAAALLARMMARTAGGSRQLGLFTMGVLCLSYPVLFMLARANVAGFVGLLDFLFLFSLRTGRHRRAGWLALAIAVNLRPESSLLALMELTLPASLPRQFLRMAIPGALSIALAAIAFALAHAAYPDYTLEHMRQGLGLYNRLYVQGGGGDDWNAAFPMFTRDLTRALGLPAAIDSALARLALAAGLVVLAAGIWRVRTGRMAWQGWLFLLCALPALMMPVHAYYHMVRFLPLVVWLVHDLAANPPRAGDARLALLALAGLALCPLGTASTQGLVVVALLFMGGDVALFPAPQAAAARVAAGAAGEFPEAAGRLI